MYKVTCLNMALMIPFVRRFCKHKVSGVGRSGSWDAGGSLLELKWRQ